jgi:hypothetical protein
LLEFEILSLSVFVLEFHSHWFFYAII